MTPLVDLTDIAEATERLAGHIRATPVIDVTGAKISPLPDELPKTAGDAKILLKLECLQVTGSFKPRGAVNKTLSLKKTTNAHGICTASGGNHGAGVAYAGWVTGMPATVFLPRSAPPEKIAKIERWGARVEVTGDVWDDANIAAKEFARTQDVAYIHPFADPKVIAGQGTIGLELMRAHPEIDTLLVAVGGGGLIAGVATAARALNPDIHIVGIEPAGAPTLFASLAAGHLVTLDTIETNVGTLAPRRSAAINLDIIGKHVDRMVQVTDAEMAAAAIWLWQEMGVAAELSGAAALAALMTGRAGDKIGKNIAVLVCGAGSDGLVKYPVAV